MPRKRRLSKARDRVRLEELSDSDLQEVRLFGNLYKTPGVLLFVASPEEQQRAREILKQRESSR